MVSLSHDSKMESSLKGEQSENGEVSLLEPEHNKVAPTTRRVSLRNRTQKLVNTRKSSQWMSEQSGIVSSPLDKSNDSNQVADDSLEQCMESDKDGSTSFCHNEVVSNFQCGICSKNFESMDLLSCHMDEHCRTDMFQCNACSVVFSSADSLSSHLEEHSDVVKPFKCGICNAGFFENAALLDHLDGNHVELPSLYKCNVCLILFKEISKLISHVMKKHPPVCTDYRCRLCGKCFTQGTKLSLHVQTHNLESAQLSKCSVCFSMVPSSIMNKHMKAHANEKSKETLVTRKSQGLKRKGTKLGKVKECKAKRNSTQHKTSIENDIDRLEDKMAKIENEERNAKNKETNPENADLKDNMEVKRARKKRKEPLVKLDKTLLGKRSKSSIADIEDLEDIKVNSVGNTSTETVLKLKPSVLEKKPRPAIKDQKKLIAAFMKIDPQSNSEVYDCDVCGERLQDRTSFIHHRDDHFFNDKFCIHCQHCSQIFDTFENLYAHVGKDKCKGYKCETCEKSFALQPHLLTHQIKEHANQTKSDMALTCLVCEKAFETRTAYLRHASSHSEDKCIQCKLCRHAFTTQETLFGHLRTTHSLIPLTRQLYKFNCGACGTNFMKIEALTKHLEVVHNIQEDAAAKSDVKITNPKPQATVKLNIQTAKRTGHWRSAEDDKKRRTCPVCNRVFRRFKDVRRHIGTHTKPYLCSHCGKSFPYRYALDAHIKAFHSAENPWKCLTCNKFFSCQRSLIVHQRIHTGEKPHQCHICQKSFRQVANLSMHIKLHNTEKPIKCELCDYRCSHQGYLKRHMSTHSTEKKHFCSICNKGFTEKPNLNHHLKRHMKIKNHVCAVCGHSFAERYYLNNHMRIHTKEKPYICPVCNRAFTMRPNMVSHIKKTHPTYNYQPIRPSHQHKSNSTSKISNNKFSDTSMVVAPQNYPAAATSATIIPISCDDNSVPALSSTPHLLPTTSQTVLQPPQPTQSSLPPISTNTIPLPPFHHHLTDTAAELKTDTLPFPTPRDLLVHHPIPQMESQQPDMREAIIHHEQVVRREPTVLEQTIRQESERHQNYINLTDRFAPSQFDPHRGMPVPGQNFPPVPMTSQDYMYTYPSMPPDPFMQGYFPVTNQHNPHAEQQKP